MYESVVLSAVRTHQSSSSFRFGDVVIMIQRRQLMAVVLFVNPALHIRYLTLPDILTKIIYFFERI